MSAMSIDLVKHLVECFPRLEPLLQEHIDDNFGTILPHLFIADLCRYVVSLAVRGNAKSDSIVGNELRSILDYLERVYEQGNEEIQELISVSFLEQLPRFDDPGSEIREMVGLQLAKQLNVIG